MGIIRDTAEDSEPRLFKKWIVSGDDSIPHIDLESQSFPRRRNLLQARTLPPPDEGGQTAAPKIHIIRAGSCTCDRLPATKAVFGLFISAILDRLAATLVTQKLNETVLKDVKIENFNHVLTAITTPLAQAVTHYQLYEFFGDSVLKFTVSCHLFFTQPEWNEGCLSENRYKFIQNKRLARAALDTGLDRFILNSRFTPRKWDAPFISQKSATTPGTRKLSIKVLADVAEALIGAAYMDGGMHKAQACLHRFLPEMNVFTNNIASVTGPTAKGTNNPIDQNPVAHPIGYTFKDVSLLTEALTQSSCEYDTVTKSYQRIEFLGDAVLDMVVVSVLAAHPNQMPEGKMTLIKHAVINANLLSFLCMDFAVSDPSTNPVKSDQRPVSCSGQINLWHFLRSHGPIIETALAAGIERYHALRDKIKTALNSGTKYPWELFACLRADKFFSDIVESTLGAIFIDSGGSLDKCKAFLERIGLLPYLHRVIADTVDVQHPRNAAQDLMKDWGNCPSRLRRSKRMDVLLRIVVRRLLTKSRLQPWRVVLRLKRLSSKCRIMS